jgi:hypothetical protein
VQKGQACEAEEERKARVDEPENAKDPDFAGIRCQNELEAGNRGRERGYRAIALRANRLTGIQSVATTTAKHGASSKSQYRYAYGEREVPEDPGGKKQVKEGDV